MASINISGNHINADRVGIQQINNNHSPDPLERLRPAERATYKTRHGADGDQPRGCMVDTRVQIIADLEAWAQDDAAPKVYWLNGHLGTGKTSIAHTFSERLDGRQMLGASFFCSRSALRDASRIIPTIATMLARSDPEIRSAMREILTSDPDVADLNSLPQQFNSLVVNPIKCIINKDIKIYKVIVIDALDECSSPRIVESLIKAIFNGVVNTPLKFFILSRPEDWIKRALRRVARPSLLQEFSLHNVAKSDVQRDIKTYLTSALSDIVESRSFSPHDPPWPPEEELKALVVRSDGLFIYAATSIRYIGARGVNFRRRLTEIVRPGPTSVLQGSTIDNLYLMIMDQAFDKLEDGERILRREVLTSVVLFQTPLSMTGMASLLHIPIDQTKADLSLFHSVVHVPFGSHGHISIFHASFREFIVDPARCGDGHHIDADKGHEMLAVKCLLLLNSSLRKNICDLREDRIGLAHEISDRSVIPEALRYSCLYWAVHLADAFQYPLANISPALEYLRTFANEHLLHWFECLSVFGELEIGLKSLAKANETLSKYANAHAYCKPIALVFEDARRCLQMGFDAIKHHCLNAYHPVLMWLPKKSLIREKYRSSLVSVPLVVAGLSESWGPMEHVIHHPDMVFSAASSNDGTRVVSASGNTVRIWNATTGEMEHILEGHSGLVRSVVFSNDGTRVISGSYDKSVLIWNANTGDIEHTLEGHSDWVTSVAISDDGTCVVSGSWDRSVRLWNVNTGEIEHILEGHSDCVASVAISHDGTRVVSGSEDDPVRIWNVTTREIEQVLEGHSSWVLSIAISHDGTRVACGLDDHTVRIWNATTGEMEYILNGHSYGVCSVALSRDGTRVVSGSWDKSVRVWNAATGKIEQVLKGHSDRVTSVAFSPDGTHVVSSSQDRTVRIWKATTNGSEHILEGHLCSVQCMAFSHDGTRMVSGSGDKSALIWNVNTGEAEVALEGHSDMVTSIAFSFDGSQVVSGSDDKTARIWSANTGKTNHVLCGHFYGVSSVAFSHDGTRVVSGSYDNLVRIWTAATMTQVLRGHSDAVNSVAFSGDGTHIVSGSVDNTVRIWNVNTGEVELVFGDPVTSSVAFLRRETPIVSGSTFEMWNAAMGEIQGHSDQVRSVAFSPDGTYVVSGSWDNSVVIWNVITGHSTSLPYSECFRFPDKSKVTHIFPSWFQLFARDQQMVFLSLDRKWIFTDQPSKTCWIPPEFRDFHRHAISGSKVCLVCESGRVVIVDLMLLH